MSTTTTTTTTTVLKKPLPKQEKEVEKKEGNEPDFIPLTVIRILLVCLAYGVYSQSDTIQIHIDVLWEWLRHQWWFTCVYFETFLVQAYSFPAMFPYRVLHTTGLGKKFKIDKTSAEYFMLTYRDIIMEAVEYTWPLFILDTFHVKSYQGVTEDVLIEKRKDWIQTTRALPVAPPVFGDLVRHLLIGLVLYDFMFFLCHYTFHRNATLYRLFHYVHHEHESVYAKVSNQLHVVERVLLVLSANFGLKVQGAHPLTRSIFVFVFISALIDNHSGYDFPYSYDKILPKGLIAGPRRHYYHHVRGSRHYQPFFTYIDNALEWYRKRKRTKQC